MGGWVIGDPPVVTMGQFQGGSYFAEKTTVGILHPIQLTWDQDRRSYRKNSPAKIIGKSKESDEASDQGESWINLSLKIWCGSSSSASSSYSWLTLLSGHIPYRTETTCLSLVKCCRWMCLGLLMNVYCDPCLGYTWEVKTNVSNASVPKLRPPDRHHDDHHSLFGKQGSWIMMIPNYNPPKKFNVTPKKKRLFPRR